MNNNPLEFSPIEFSDFTTTGENHNSTTKESIAKLADLRLDVIALLGKRLATVEEVNQYKVGDIIEIDREAGHTVDICVGKQKIAIGEIVPMENNFGLSIIEVVSSSEELLKNVRKNGEVE